MACLNFPPGAVEDFNWTNFQKTNNNNKKQWATKKKE